jgi:hypothetical protein
MLTSLAARALSGQSEASSLHLANKKSSAVAVPTHLLYYHFLAWVRDLDAKATLSGTSDTYKFAEPFAEQVGLQGKHLDLIRTEAYALEKDLAGPDLKARALVMAFRASVKSALANSGPMPVRPEKLGELQQEHDTLIKSHVSILRAALGSEAATKLDRYVVGTIGSHTDLQMIALPKPQLTPPAK